MKTRLERLSGWMGQFDSALVAYSGGVDSALVLAAAHARLGDRAVACIGISPSYPERERRAAVELAEKIGASCRLARTPGSISISRYAANPVNRCYFCKSELYEVLAKVAEDENFAVILDGTNADDLHQDRPGYRAAVERGVRSPLAELGHCQADRAASWPITWAWRSGTSRRCRAWLRACRMAWPSFRSFSSASSAPKTCWRGLGFGNSASAITATSPASKFSRIRLRVLEHQAEILQGVRAAGYNFVTLDLAAFESGSLHEIAKRA